MDSDFDLESLVHLEQTFYDTGYQDGFAHGRIHGSLRAARLGREKGFEMWEELGFYEGFARSFRDFLAAQGRTDDRAMGHVTHLLDLIAKFPMVNPSAQGGEGELDIPKLFRQIRSRYKLLCASLGVRSSMRAADAGEDEAQTPPEEGRAGKKKSVWQVNSPGAEGQGLSF